MVKEFHKAVRRVVVLSTAPGGQAASLEFYRRDDGKKRKRSRLLKQPERWIRAIGHAHLAAIQAYIDRHERSTQKRRDGWVLDFAPNVMRAMRTGSKRIKLRRLVRVPVLNP